MNKKDVLLVCALRKETQGQLTDWLGGDDWEILYTGVGKVNATYGLTRYLSENKLPKLVVNYGTAGSRKLPIGELVDCTKFVQRDMKIEQLGFMDLQTPYESANSIVILSTSKFISINKSNVTMDIDFEIKYENLLIKTQRNKFNVLEDDLSDIFI